MPSNSLCWRLTNVANWPTLKHAYVFSSIIETSSYPRTKQTPLSLRIVGCSGSGWRTIAGCLLYKFNGVSLLNLEKFQADGISNYRDVIEGLHSQGVPLQFETPKHRVSIIESNVDTVTPDMWLVIVSPEFHSEELTENLRPPPAAKVIVLVSKMDSVEWSQATFDSKVGEVSSIVPNATYIPCSGLNGENFIDLSSRSPWYAEKFESTAVTFPEQGTLLATIDSFFDS